MKNSSAWRRLTAILLSGLMCLGAVALTVAALLSVLPALPATAADWGPTESDPLATDKTVYAEGEPVLVKAIASGKDWVGIYEISDVYPNIGSIYWYYPADYAADEAVNIRGICEVGQTQKDLGREGLPAGSYKVILFSNDGYTEIDRIDITVEPGPNSQPDAPMSVNYSSANAGKGRADGKLAITHGNSAPQSYLLQWANADGPIEDYTDIATVPCTGVSTEYTMTPNTLIPVGADRILAYAVRGTLRSDKAAVAMLPKGAGDYELGEIHQELQVMSDIHINTDSNHPYNQQFSAALREIKKLSPDTLGVFINGDIADLGLAENYTAYQRILKSAGKDLNVVAAMGNHDFYCHKYGGPNLTDAEKIAQFMKGTGNDSETVYFDRWIDGTHFVFLGSEAFVPPNAQLSDAQLDWLKDTLEKDKAEGRPVFLFLHEGIMDTVAGTMGYQGWHGVEQGKELKAIIDAHPEVILFSGHSHWVLESPVTILPGDGKAATHVSTSSCAYLWDDNANITNVGINGSQGYYIYLYDDCIVFRGRSFSTGEWISTAQFVIDWDFGDAWGKDTEETTPETTPETPPESLPETTPDTIAPNVETTADTATPDTATPDTGTPTPETPADTTAVTDTPAAGGCASAAGMVALLAVPAGAALIRRRRDE